MGYSVSWCSAAVLEAGCAEEFHADSRPVVLIMRGRAMRLNKAMTCVQPTDRPPASIPAISGPINRIALAEFFHELEGQYSYELQKTGGATLDHSASFTGY